MWQCWNVRCPNYAGYGVTLRGHDAYADQQGHVHCRTCHAFVRHVPGRDEDTAKVTGAASGALVGLALGGPPGALIGGLIGLLIGANSGSKGS